MNVDGLLDALGESKWLQGKFGEENSGKIYILFNILTTLAAVAIYVSRTESYENPFD